MWLQSLLTAMSRWNQGFGSLYCHLELGELFQGHSGCWPNSGPWRYRNGIPISWPDVIQKSFLGPKCHIDYLPQPAMEDIQHIKSLLSCKFLSLNIFLKEEALWSSSPIIVVLHESRLILKTIPKISFVIK